MGRGRGDREQGWGAGARAAESSLGAHLGRGPRSGAIVARAATKTGFPTLCTVLPDGVHFFQRTLGHKYLLIGGFDLTTSSRKLLSL